MFIDHIQGGRWIPTILIWPKIVQLQLYFYIIEHKLIREFIINALRAFCTEFCNPGKSCVLTCSAYLERVN